jgi:hypothetical protein
MCKYLLVDHAGAGDVSQRCRGHVEGGLAIGECTDHASATPDFAQDAPERIVGAEAPPGLLREGVVG